MFKRIRMKAILFIWMILSLVFVSTPYGLHQGLDEVEQANPNYQFKNKHFQHLVDQHNKFVSIAEDRVEYLTMYQSECSMFASNWEKVSDCISAYKICEMHLPDGENQFEVLFSAMHDDKYPNYSECIDKFSSTKWHVKDYLRHFWSIIVFIPAFILSLPLYFVFGESGMLL
jgi:hypothetical protein